MCLYKTSKSGGIYLEIFIYFVQQKLETKEIQHCETLEGGSEFLPDPANFCTPVLPLEMSHPWGSCTT